MSEVFGNHFISNIQILNDFSPLFIFLPYRLLNQDDQVAWYVKQQQVPSGAKRKFDEITYTEASTHSVDEVENSMDTWRPWRWFRRWGLVDGKTLVELEAEWKELTEGPDSQARWERDQWVVPEWDGIVGGVERRTGQSQQVTRAAAVTSSEQLATLQVQGQSLLNQFQTSILPAPQVMQSHLKSIHSHFILWGIFCNMNSLMFLLG